MQASVGAWIGIMLSVLGIVSTAGNWLFAYGSLTHTVSVLRTDLTRNFYEDKEHVTETFRRMERLETTIGTMASFKAEIEVMKTQLIQVNKTLERMERQLDRKVPK